MCNEKDINPYEDIINLPHHISTTHPQMSLRDRAAQFSPFAALTGHDEAIKETERLTNSRMELDKDIKMRLNEKLQIVNDNIHVGIAVTFTYFVPDERKEGGEYVTHTGSVKKIDRYKNVVIMNDTTIIPIEEITEIESEMFDLDYNY